jgi:hypothetical protein
MLGILKFKVRLPLHYNLCFDLHSVKTDRQLIISLPFPVLGVDPNEVDFPISHTHTNFVGDSHHGRINQTYNHLCVRM